MGKIKKLSMLLIATLAMLLAPTAANAQQRNMTIVTNHPDFSIKVKRCVASGKTVIIDMILENLGTNDVKLAFAEWRSSNEGKAWDDQGNIYETAYKYANASGYDTKSCDDALIAGVPTKLSVKIEGVPADVEYIAKLSLQVICSEWGFTDRDEKRVVIRNIPITRQ